MVKKTLLLITVLIMSFSLLIFSCGENGEDDNGMAGKGGKVEIAYVEWARAIAITHVAGELLEKMGYDVKLNSVANAAMWASVAAGDSEALLCAWLPVTHADLYEEYESNIIDLGPNYTGAKLGIVVPEYVTIDSITEMKDHAEKFDGEITGIDAGAGMSKAIEEAIEENTSGLGEFEYTAGTDAIMVAALKAAIENEEWIAIPGWQPHWMFGEWDLKILDDPDNIFGDVETINTIVREGLAADMPEVATFFKEFDWQSVDLGSLLVMNKENPGDIEGNAEKWVEDNMDKLKAAMPASLSFE